MERQLLTKLRARVPRYHARDFVIPQLKEYDLSAVEVTAADGSLQKITPGGRPDRFTIRFVNQTPNSVVELSIYILKEGSEKKAEPKDAKKSEKSTPAPPEPVAESGKGKKKGLLTKLQIRQEERAVAKQRRIEEIREARALALPGLRNKRVLTFDHCGCWARALGMIQKAVQLRHQIKRPLHDYYHRITGQGDGAIIAAAVASGVSLDDLAKWWLSEWKKVHTPGFLKRSGRWAVSKIVANQSGYDAKRARKALRKLFLKESGLPLRFKDVLTELHITVIQADLRVSLHMSDQHPRLETWAACEDSAVTKIHYNQKETIKGEAVFLGAIEKNDVLGLTVSPDNEGLQITSIGAPARVSPEKAQKLAALGHAADKMALQSAGHFVYERRVNQVIQKLTDAGYKIRYLRLECRPMDGIVSNSTTDQAMRLGMESGGGKLSLPSWFSGTFRKTA